MSAAAAQDVGYAVRLAGKHLSYRYLGVSYRKGKEYVLKQDLAEYLVGTGYFEYAQVSAPKPIAIGKRARTSEEQADTDAGPEKPRRKRRPSRRSAEV